ncbi:MULTISPECIES: hypothetical protein [Nocardia]|uniref:hypothetical protein n=1 Tax=Nocardia TaxID=1817 RepID=UPI0018951E44|nr:MULTISPECIES: hypothetical protein [Nocardia]MBF6350737.1 hypothetical protein [Nocardia flavorosea]
MKLVRAISGSLAAGLVVLACVVVGAAMIGARRGFPGPGAESVGWHIAVAATAVAAQIYSDRKRGTATFVVAAFVLGAAALLLWTQWWN